LSDRVTKPRVRVQAGSPNKAFVGDSFANFAGNLGYGTQNPSSGATYGFHPLSRDRTLLEWMYRGSWLVRKVVDCPADDMTREGINIESDMPPDDIDEFTQFWNNLQLWQRINATLKWARLYGGCLAVMMIADQDPETPLRIDTIGKNQFKGLMVLDRWMVWPHNDLVRDYGADYGKPKLYEVVADARSQPRLKVHYSRVIRFDGVELPYWQKMSENEWGLSVIEPLWDRMIAFDSATQGAAQLIYKAHLRILKLPQYRELIASGGAMFQAVMRQIQMIRMMQTNEGLTVLDGEDDFVSQQYNFGGLAEMMIQFGQQVSGAADVPMTRMFGQSPAGMNATGESDLRNYYDGIRSQQEFRLRRVIKQLLDITYRSMTGRPLPRGFNFSFKPLWQLTDEIKAQIATAHATATEGLLQAGVFTPAIALKEIRQSSRLTGFGSNITDEDIEAAEQAPPMPMEAGMPGAPGQPGLAGPEGDMPVPGVPGPEQQPGLPGLPAGREAPMELAPREALRRLSGAATGRQAATEEDDAARSPEPLAGAHIKLHEGVTARANLPGTQVNFDRRSIIDMGGLQCVIETAKGEQRLGYGWADVMPCNYGYITGTSSAEGEREQMDCFVGDDLTSDRVWIIDQINPGTAHFDEHKVMLGFSSRDDALQTYHAAFGDGSGPARVGTVREMSIGTLKRWLEDWKYANAPPRRSANGDARYDR
jgi:phage-related protein (TIGR01555 family)